MAASGMVRGGGRKSQIATDLLHAMFADGGGRPEDAARTIVEVAHGPVVITGRRVVGSTGDSERAIGAAWPHASATVRAVRCDVR